MANNKNTLLYYTLADEILSYIEREKIQCGQRIPSERRLAELFSTSRTSVREAVRILENQNIIKVELGKGMYLRNKVPAGAYQIELWKIDYKEILEVKTLLEVHVIEDVCEYLPDSSIRPIEEALQQLERGYDKGFFDQPADSLFHKRIRDCSSNQTLVQLLDSLISKLDSYERRIDERGRLIYWYNTVPYHRVMLNSILNHDVEKAKAAFYTICELDKKALNGEV